MMGFTKNKRFNWLSCLFFALSLSSCARQNRPYPQGTYNTSTTNDSLTQRPNPSTQAYDDLSLNTLGSGPFIPQAQVQLSNTPKKTCSTCGRDDSQTTDSESKPHTRSVSYANNGYVPSPSLVPSISLDARSAPRGSSVNDSKPSLSHTPQELQDLSVLPFSSKPVTALAEQEEISTVSFSPKVESAPAHGPLANVSVVPPTSTTVVPYKIYVLEKAIIEPFAMEIIDKDVLSTEDPTYIHSFSHVGDYVIIVVDPTNHIVLKKETFSVTNPEPGASPLSVNKTITFQTLCDLYALKTASSTFETALEGKTSSDLTYSLLNLEALTPLLAAAGCPVTPENTLPLAATANPDMTNIAWEKIPFQSSGTYFFQERLWGNIKTQELTAVKLGKCFPEDLRLIASKNKETFMSSPKTSYPIFDDKKNAAPIVTRNSTNATRTIVLPNGFTPYFLVWVGKESGLVYSSTEIKSVNKKINPINFYENMIDFALKKPDAQRRRIGSSGTVEIITQTEFQNIVYERLIKDPKLKSCLVKKQDS